MAHITTCCHSTIMMYSYSMLIITFPFFNIYSLSARKRAARLI